MPSPCARSAGMKPDDFNARALARGTRVELEHTCNHWRAQRIAMDHLAEDSRYYEKLAAVHGEPYRANLRGPRVVDAEDVARDVRETFYGRPVGKRYEFPWRWPVALQHVGDSLAVGYASDKWWDDGEHKLYKHLAESNNRALVVPRVLCAFDEPARRLEVIGPLVSLADVPMPRHFALLAKLEEVDLRLHTAGTDEAPELGGGDDGVVQVTVAHGWLGASMIRWSTLGRRADQPFLFVYTASAPLMMIVGDKLGVEKDGIVG